MCMLYELPSYTTTYDIFISSQSLLEIGKVMAKMRQYTYLEMTKVVKRNGYKYARCTGDHCIYKREDGSGTIVLAKKKHINPCIARRLIKEHNLIVDL